MTSKLQVWHRDEGGQFAAIGVDQPLWFADASPVPSEEHRSNAVGIHPVSSRRGTIGAALVPVELDAVAELNGVPLRAGLHALRHADRLGLNGRAVWLATSAAVETTTYDPAIHRDVFCFLTKAPLKPGQAIVVCPASPGKTCDAIYTERAWELAMTSATMKKCANCGFRPGDSEWKPSEPQPRETLNERLVALTTGQV